MNTVVEMSWKNNEIHYYFRNIRQIKFCRVENKF